MVEGARQESESLALCGFVEFGSTFPEVLETSAEATAAEGNDGIGPALSPVHSGAFESCSDDHLAASLDNAG